MKWDPLKPIYVSLTRDAGTENTSIATEIFQSLVSMYNNRIEYNPLTLKGVITTCIGKKKCWWCHIAFYLFIVL